MNETKVHGNSSCDCSWDEKFVQIAEEWQYVHLCVSILKMCIVTVCMWMRVVSSWSWAPSKTLTSSSITIKLKGHFVYNGLICKKPCLTNKCKTNWDCKVFWLNQLCDLCFSLLLCSNLLVRCFVCSGNAIYTLRKCYYTLCRLVNVKGALCWFKQLRGAHAFRIVVLIWLPWSEPHAALHVGTLIFNL